jgi:hypothetical protein
VKYVIGTFFLLFFYSCADDPSGPEYKSEYYPLSIGNKWSYTGFVEMEIEISELRWVNNLPYFVLVRTFPAAADTLLLRYVSDNRLVILFEEKEYLYIDFTFPKGSKWDSYYNFYGEIRETGLQATVPAGTFSGVTEVLFENTLISDVYEFNRYAPGVGLISSHGFRRSFELKSAFVNGKNYPTPEG